MKKFLFAVIALTVFASSAFAFSHIYFNDQTQYGRQLRRTLQMMEESDTALKNLRDVMIQMREGADNPEDHTNYAEITSRFGFTSNAKAREAFLELDSCYSKTSGNGSVDNVRAARDQFFAKLRG